MARKAKNEFCEKAVGWRKNQFASSRCTMKKRDRLPALN
jgi:hypothetical protein